MTITRNRAVLALLGISLLATAAYASSGDRMPTFQQCLKGCRISQCDPSQPPLPAYLRAFGWTCEDDCRYSCGHAFTDHIRTGSRYHQCESATTPKGRQLICLSFLHHYASAHYFVCTVYGKWAFYRLGPIQEPFSVLMSFGNFWAHWEGFKEVKRRVRSGNRLRPWLFALAIIQMNTWIWSAVFHTRGTCIVSASWG
jgi:hypothetical protein